MKQLVTRVRPNLLRKTALPGIAGVALLAGCADLATTEQRELAPEPELTLQFAPSTTQPAAPAQSETRITSANEEALPHRGTASQPVTNVNLSTPPTMASTDQPVRDFNRTTAVYQNGDIASGTTGARYTTRDDTNVYLLPFAETGVFLANLATSPVTFYQQRNGILSTGPQFPVTHTAMPVLPPRLDQPQPAAQQDTTPTIQPGEALPPQGSEPSVSTPLPSDNAQTTPTEPAQPTPSDVQPPSSDVTSAPQADVAPVTLTPAAELSTTAFAIVGGVSSPGRYEAQENLTLSQAILAAGLGEVDHSKVTVTIERAGIDPSSATLDEILSGQTANPTIQAGDVVTVTVAP